MKISVLIPAKNEPRLVDLVEQVNSILKGYDHEIIIIDKSNETPVVSGANVINQERDGLGNAVLEGVKAAKGDVLVTMDGDFSHDPKDIPKLLEKAGMYDVVIGSRFVEGGKTLDTTHRKLISEIVRKLISIILGLDVKDNMSGFCAVKRKVYDEIKLHPIGYKINMEILYKAKKFGYKYTEVPISFQKRQEGKSKASLLEPFRILIYSLRLKIGL